MKCPKCGSSKAKQIAPNFFQCTGVIKFKETVEKYVVNPNIEARTDYRQQKVVYVTVEEDREKVCGARYQFGSVQTTAGTCWCGTFAIGLCSSCNGSVCGDHSTLRSKRFCRDCEVMMGSISPAIQQLQREESAYSKYLVDAPKGADIVDKEHSCQFCATSRFDIRKSRAADPHRYCRNSRRLCRDCFVMELREQSPTAD
jgi:hypothetical protein